MQDRQMTAADSVKSFNEWMRRYTEEPSRFNAEFQTVGLFLKEQADGQEPTYGETCTAYQFKLLDEMNAAA